MFIAIPISKGGGPRTGTSRRPLLQRLDAVLAPSDHVLIRPASTPLPPGPMLTVISANLWHDWPRFRRAHTRLERFARLVEAQQADVLLLQEVWRTPTFSALEWLAERLQYHAAYVRANGHQTAIGFEEGVAVLSRYPQQRSAVRQWPDGRLARRVALGVQLLTPWGKWLAVSAHLSLFRRRNAAQVLDLQRWIAQLTGTQPALIGGDFNADENRPVIRQLGRAWLDLLSHLQPGADRITHEIRWPLGRLHAARLDYLYLKPGSSPPRLLRATLLDGRHSDHRPVLAQLVPGSPRR